MDRASYKGTFRIDDVSVNTDIVGLVRIVAAIRDRLPDSRVLLAVSPIAHDLSEEPPHERGRVFPKILNAMSDHRVFYRVDRIVLPDLILVESYFPGHVDLASHGLLHVDHRLLPREVQELSILVSSSLVKSKVLVPPYNKWNRDTEEICREHGIRLVKWEDGWRHASHNGFDPTCPHYYLHAHDTTAAEIAEWLDR